MQSKEQQPHDDGDDDADDANDDDDDDDDADDDDDDGDDDDDNDVEEEEVETDGDDDGDDGDGDDDNASDDDQDPVPQSPLRLRFSEILHLDLWSRKLRKFQRRNIRIFRPVFNIAMQALGRESVSYSENKLSGKFRPNPRLGG